MQEPVIEPAELDTWLDRVYLAAGAMGLSETDLDVCAVLTFLDEDSVYTLGAIAGTASETAAADDVSSVLVRLESAGWLRVRNEPDGLRITLSRPIRARVREPHQDD